LEVVQVLETVVCVGITLGTTGFVGINKRLEQVKSDKLTTIDVLGITKVACLVVTPELTAI
jgi:hypothetical protein